MRKLGYLACILLTAAGSFLAGAWYSGREAERIAPAATNLGHLSKEFEDESLPAAPGAVKISAARKQLIGVRVATVEKKPVTHTLRLLGRVAADETRIYRINASVDGWIQRALPHTVGSLVKQDELLASFYSAQLLDAQQTYIYALDTVDRLRPGNRKGLSQLESPAQVTVDQLTLQRQIDNLRSLGMTDVQIEEIGKNRRLTHDVRITSPVRGLIIARNVSPGQRFLKGESLYQIVDLRRIWILADVFENEAAYFRPGAKATVHQPHRKLTLPATASEVPPVFDASTRTLKVRLDADNPDLILRPEMFADVELTLDLPPAVFVPADAVIFSGRRKTVFVEIEEGVYEPRRVETGRRVGDRIEITSGIAPSERIVVSGNFLIDSESRLQAAAQGIYGAMSADPACGAEVDELKARAAGNASSYQGRTYFFSGRECKEKFDQDPARYVVPPASQ
jgi:Cu(I)/Ag(I) efflux system membrane fusion protein